MNELLNTLFGLGGGDQSLGFGTPEAHPGFTHAMPAWSIVLVTLILIAIALWSYRALPGRRSARWGLGLLRALTLVLLFLLALGPRIEQTQIENEPDWVLVLLDRSTSLQTPDASSAGSERERQLRDMLAAGSDAWDELSRFKRVLWVGFDERPRLLGEGNGFDPLSLAPPSGQGTDIDGAIRDALRQAAARPISAIVIASDGRTTRAIDPELVDTLGERQIPIVSVPLGSPDPVRDLAIERVDHPDAVFGKDIAPIRVRLGARGIDADELERHPSFVELVDHERGEVLDRARIDPSNIGEDAQALTLSHTPSGDGDRRLDLRIVTDRSTRDLNPSNDTQSIEMRVVDRPLRVLYIDGYPRWEQRYIKAMLLREPSIVSSSLLLSATRRYIQEGDELIASVPSTLDAWEPFDVIVLGDVRPEMFSAQQLETLREHIETRGAGLLWLAGPSSVPDAYMGSSLASLLPMRPDAGGSQSTTQVWSEPVTMRASPEATRLGVLRLSDDGQGWLERLSEPGTGWSELNWAIALDDTSFKPGVSVLASAEGTQTQRQAPIITMMRYGAGASAFVGTDEIWRWRYGRGEDLPERFWLPLIRSLGRGTVARRAAPAQLIITPAEPTPGEAAQVTLRVFDQRRIDAMPERIRVRVTSLADRSEPTEIELRGTGDTRSGVWVPARAGNFEVRPVGLDAEMSTIAQRARVYHRSDERRQLDSDHELLASISASTGGWVALPDAFGQIPDQLPNRARTIVSPPRRASLWDRPIVLIVLVTLLTVEWIGRRTLRLA